MVSPSSKCVRLPGEFYTALAALPDAGSQPFDTFLVAIRALVPAPVKNLNLAKERFRPPSVACAEALG